MNKAKRKDKKMFEFIKKGCNKEETGAKNSMLKESATALPGRTRTIAPGNYQFQISHLVDQQQQ